MRARRRQALVLLPVAGVLVAGLLASPSTVLSRLGTLLYSPWFPIALAGLYLVRPLLAWPISAISALVGYRYGLVLGVPVALAGVIVTSCIPYAAARYLRTDAGWLGRATEGSERFFDATGDLRGVIAARLAPVPAEAISGAAGIGRVSLPAFVLGTAIGELPWTGAAVLAGHSMRRVSLSGAGTADPRLLAAGLLAAALLLAGPAYRAARARLAA